MMPKVALVLVACWALLLAGCPEPSLKEQAKEQLVVAQTKPAEPGSAEKPKADEPPIPLDKWSATGIEKMWTLKLKGVTFTSGQYLLLLDLTRDLTAEELSALKETFPASAGKSKPDSKSTTTVVAYFFDKDNVVLEKQPDCVAASELTGVQGDAFRVGIPAPKSADAVRAELRQVKDGVVVRPAPKTVGTADVDPVKAEKAEYDLEPGKSVDVKLTGTKAETFKIDPEDKGVTAKIDGDKLTITADKEKAADKATFTIKVYADKASKAKHAEIKVTIKK